MFQGLKGDAGEVILGVVASLIATGLVALTVSISRKRRFAPASAALNPAPNEKPAPFEVDTTAPVAKLLVGSHYRDSRVHHITTANSTGKGMVYQSLFVFNDGEKAVRDATLLLWIPMQFDPVENFDWKHPDERFGTFGFKYVANVPYEGGKRYWHMTYDIPFPIYPKAPPRLILRFPLWVPVPTTDDVLWRIYYDGGVTPTEEEPSGRLGVTTMPKH
jgi:hypothetical protein